MAWNTALTKYISTIQNYMREVGDVGAKFLGTQWSQSEKEITSMKSLLEKFSTDSLTFAALMNVCDSIEDISRNLNRVADTVLNPNVQETVLVGMSRTYSENLKGFKKSVLEAGNVVNALHRDAASLAASAGAAAASQMELAEISNAYSSQELRDGISTQLYVNALLCHARVHPKTSAHVIDLLSVASDMALGGAKDTPAAAKADHAALAEYHPLQAMSYIPTAFGPKIVDIDKFTNVSLPRARFAVTYTIESLIERKTALMYGPMATMTTGLNYRLVERLQTIQTEPLAAAAATAAAATAAPQFVNKGESVWISTDRGKTARSLSRDCEGSWAPFAGRRPRVEHYATASSAIILAAIREERKNGWGLDLRVQYEESVLSGRVPRGECGENALLIALTDAFEKQYDAKPPENPQEFRELVVPERPGAEDYICMAVAKVGFGALELQLHALHVRYAAACVPYEVAVREMRTTQAIQVVDAGRKLLVRIKNAFRSDSEPFNLPPVQRKTILLKNFRRIAEIAIKESPIECSPPTLKSFAALMS